MPKERCFFKSLLPQQARSVKDHPSVNIQQSYVGVVVAGRILLAQKSSVSLFIRRNLMEVLVWNNIWMRWFYKYHTLTVSPTFLTSPGKGGKADSFFFQITKKLEKKMLILISICTPKKLVRQQAQKI